MIKLSNENVCALGNNTCTPAPSGNQSITWFFSSARGFRPQNCQKQNVKQHPKLSAKVSGKWTAVNFSHKWLVGECLFETLFLILLSKVSGLLDIHLRNSSALESSALIIAGKKIKHVSYQQRPHWEHTVTFDVCLCPITEASKATLRLLYHQAN